MRSFTFLVVAALLCGCGSSSDSSTGSDTPVEVATANLAGYWVSMAGERAPAWPMLVHFEAELHPSELNPGFERYAELVGFAGETSLATYELDGDAVMFTTPSGVRRSATILGLTRDELRMNVGGQDLTFRRRSGCAGPSLWYGGQLGEAAAAAWDAHGGLHLIVSNAFYSGYAWVAPGRCLATTADVHVRAATLDTTPDGDVRGLFFTRERGAGEILVTTIPARPWARAGLDASERFVPAPSTPANTPPPMRSVDLPDGRFMVFYAYRDLHVVTVDGAGTSEVTVPLHQSSTLTPYRLELDHLPDGAFVVRGDRARSGALHRDGAWGRWTAEGQASVFSYHDGALYGAWGEGDQYGTRLVVGRQRGDGGWDTIAAGRGWPSHMRVHDGGIEIVGVYERFDRAMQLWTHLPRFEANTWRQEIAATNGTGGFFEQTMRSFGARFGPDGEVLALFNQARMRRPQDEGDELYRWIDVTVKFDAETDVALVFPTLGERCESDCHVLMPPDTVVPVELEAPDESAAAWIVGAESTLDGWSYIAEAPIGDWIQFEMTVKTAVRRMSGVVPLAADVWSEPGDVVRTAGGYAASWTEGTLAVGVVEGGAIVDEARFATSGLGPRTLAAREDGGFVVGLNALPASNRPGFVVVDAALDVAHELPLEDGVRRFAVTPQGYIGLRFPAGGAGMELIRHDVGGVSSAVPVAIEEPDELRPAGDGAIAFTRRDRAHTWTKIGRDGHIAWSLAAESFEPLVWDLVDGDLIVASALVRELTIGGQRYEQPGAYFVGRFDGASGALERHLLREVATPNGPIVPGALAADDAGVVLVQGFTANLAFVHLPWDDGGRRTDYPGDVIAGHCLQPGVACVPQPAGVAALGDGRFAAVWAQTNPTRYDGAPINGAAPRRAVSGVFTPDP